MDCLKCKTKLCRNTQSCNRESFDKNGILKNYLTGDTQMLVQSAANLVDHGKAGTLSRLEEINEFIKNMNYKRPAIAYCYAMEKEAGKVKRYLEKKGITLLAVSCTAGAFPQNEVNEKSNIENVSCNPMGQAQELNNAGADFTLVMGLCLGHDVIFNRRINGDVTTLVVKDRVYCHNPFAQIQELED